MKKRICSMLLALALIVGIIPISSLAASAASATSIDVANQADFTSALNSSSESEICVTGVFTYIQGNLETNKLIKIKNGGKLTISGGTRTVDAPLTIEEGGEFCVIATNNGTVTVNGNIANNGTISTTGTQGYCYWNAEVTGTGKFTPASTYFSSASTYIDYGLVPDNMLKDAGVNNYKINIAKDIAQSATVTLPTGLKVGDTVTPTFTNIADGVDVSEVFKYSWYDRYDSPIYDNSTKPTLTRSGTLKLTVSPKKPYVLRTSNGSMGSIDATPVTVEKNEPEIVYVDEINGNDTNLGNIKDAPVQSINGSNGALNKIKDGGTIILLSDVNLNFAVFDKNITVKSDDGKKYTVKFTDGSYYAFYISNDKKVNFENLELKDIPFSSEDNPNGSVIFKNCTGSGLSISSGQINNITFDNSSLSGDFYANEKMTLNNSTLEGKFSTKDFEENGNSTFKPKANTNGVITGNITVNGTVTVIPTKFEKGLRLIKVPNGTDVAIAAKFALSDTENGKYALKIRNVMGGDTYLGISKKISSENGKFAVAYEPVIAQPVKDNANYVDSDIRFGNFAVKSAVWSGYTNTVDKKWSLGDVPELTITLSTDSVDTNNHESGRRFGHFDSTFNVADLSVYSWDYDLETPLTYTDKNGDVQIVLKEGQGISDDGMTFTFTIRYPAVTRLVQTIETDTSDRTANCKDILEPRTASAIGSISYESSNPEIASVDAATGKITAHKAGVATITVKAAQTDLYEVAQVSYKLTVSHKYSDDFKYDATEHWKECACGDKSEKATHIGGTATCKDKAVCEVCGQPYGEVNADNHATLKHVEAKASTTEAEGNIEYWHCEDCNKYFSDKDGKNVIDLKDTVISKLAPEIIDGKGQSLTAGEKKELTFRSNAAYSDFIRVEVDGKTVDGKNYTVKEGSTIVTLKADYVATLSVGEHTLGIVSQSGTATTTFTVNAKVVNDNTSPATGDNSHMALWFALLFVSGGLLTVAGVYGKKRKYSAK